MKYAYRTSEREVIPMQLLEQVNKRDKTNTVENLKKECERLVNDNCSLKKDLEMVMTNYKMNVTNFENLIEQLNEIQGEDNLQKIKIDLKKLSSTMKLLLDAGKKFTILNQNISSVNSAFYDRLIERFPELTKSELELCAYIRLNLSNKEISSLKNISGDSLRGIRYRLRKKMNLNKREDLVKTLHQI